MAAKVGWTLLPRAVKPAAAGRSPVVAYGCAGVRQASALRGLGGWRCGLEPGEKAGRPRPGGWCGVTIGGKPVRTKNVDRSQSGTEPRVRNEMGASLLLLEGPMLILLTPFPFPESERNDNRADCSISRTDPFLVRFQGLTPFLSSNNWVPSRFER
jgi:hypothetical protein